MSSLRSLRYAGYAVAVCLAAVASLWGLPASAEDQTVEVTDSGFEPAQVSVVAGDTITWKWIGEGSHGVVVESLAGVAYQSHPDCSADATNNCGTKGTIKRWTPKDPGQFSIRCQIHPITMRGTLTVDPAPSPDPGTETTSPDPEPSPSPSGKKKTADPDPSPNTTKEGTKESSGESDSEPSGSSAPRVTRGTAGSPGGITYGPPMPIDPQPLPTILPSVAPSASPTADADDPDLERFPSAATDSPPEDELGAVAIDAPGGPTPRAVWLGIGGASILASAGAFVKLVLFGAPWA